MDIMDMYEKFYKDMDKQLIFLENNNDILKVVTKVIEFDDETKFTIDDYQLKNRWVDQSIYKNNEELWKRLPRSYSIIKINDEVVHEMCGFPKFGEEDEYRFNDKYKNLEPHTHVIMEKENGEYFGFSTFSDEITKVNYTVSSHIMQYLSFKSKNVTLVLPRKVIDNQDLMNELLDRHYSEKRYGYVKEMTTSFLKIIRSMNDYDDFLVKMRYSTLSMEFVSFDHSHIVDYGFGITIIPLGIYYYNQLHFKRDLDLFKVDKSKYYKKLIYNNQLLYLAEGVTHYSIEYLPILFQEHGIKPDFIIDNVRLKYPEFIIVPSHSFEKMESIKKIFREKKGVSNELSEGAVIYEVKRSKSKNNFVITHMYKFKNYFYVFWRRVREQIRKKVGYKQLRSALNNLYLEHPDDNSFNGAAHNELIKRACCFYRFLKNRYDYTTDNWSHLFDSYASLLTQFNEIVSDGEIEKLYDNVLVEEEEGKSKNWQVQIMPVGIPGCGKSYILKCLEKLLPGAVRVNQDECGKSAKNYLKRVAQLSNDKSVQFLLLDKCNHTEEIRKRTFSVMNVQKVIYIIFYDEVFYNHDKNEFMNKCMSNIYKRGHGHCNLVPSLNLPSIMKRFANELQNPEITDDSSNIMFVIGKYSDDYKLEHVITELHAHNLFSDTFYGNLIKYNIIKRVKAEVMDAEKQLSETNISKCKKCAVYLFVDEGDICKILNTFVKKVVNEVCEKYGLFKKTDEFHMTLFYGNRDQEVNIKSQFPNRFNYEMTLDKIQYDENAIVLTGNVYHPDYPSIPSPTIYHITLGYKKEKGAAISNTMLNNENRTIIELQIPITVNSERRTFYF